MLWKTEEEHESLSGNYSTDLPLYREATLQAVPVKGKQQQRGSCNRDCQAWQTPKRRPAAHLWVTPWVSNPVWDQRHSEAWWLENLGWGINDLIRNKTIMKIWDNIPVLICILLLFHSTVAYYIWTKTPYAWNSALLVLVLWEKRRTFQVSLLRMTLLWILQKNAKFVIQHWSYFRRSR